MSQTLGQKRVKAEFNPANDSRVDVIKQKSAELIDMIEEMRNDPSPGTGDRQRKAREIIKLCFLSKKRKSV